MMMFAACYSPDLSFTDCTLPCLHDCPSGGVCRNNFCVHTDSAATCDSGNGGSGGSAMTSSGAGGIGGMDSSVAGMVATMAAGDSGGAPPFDVQAGKTPALCPGQSYRIQLSAAGGVSPYTWALADGTPASVVLSATTGNVVQVSGLASKPQPNVQVNAHDANGGTVTTDLALSVAPVGPGQCPQITPTRLPDPCDENAYYTNDVTVTGGTAPFVWQALSIPEGLSFNATTQTLSGTALSSGSATPLTLQVTDHAGRQTQSTYPLSYRDHCWLGYTSTDSGVSKVHLLDPALSALNPDYAPALEASTNNAGVVDFKFSPDGKYLVYRRSAGSAGVNSLVLAAAPLWQEQVLDIPGSVLEYSWSLGSASLAVSYQNATETLLGGVNVASAVPGGSGGITGIQALTPVVMLDPFSAPLHSELLWFQSDNFLAFHADALPGFDAGYDSPYYAHFDGTGFSVVTPLGAALYDPGIQLLPAHNGIFAVSFETPPRLDFYSSLGGTEMDAYLRDVYVSGVADPSGLYVALPINNALHIYLTTESGGTSAVPTAWQPSTDECDSILAWDPSRERIACDARGTPPDGAPALGEVRIFDLPPCQRDVRQLPLEI